MFCETIWKIEKAEPFDAYRNSGYRQVDLWWYKQEQPTPINVSLSSACSFILNVLAVFESQEQEQKLKLCYKYEQKRYSVS